MRSRFLTGFLAVFLLGGVIPVDLCAQDGDGGTQSIFSLGAGSRAISLGRSFVSTANDASAIYWNPATLRNVQSKQLMGMYMPLFGDFTDATYSFLGVAYPTLNAGAWGLGFQRVASTFKGFDQNSVSTGEQDYSETQLLVGYAFERNYRWLLGSMATGMSFKIANQKVGGFSGTSPGIDLGLLYRPNAYRDLSVGLNLQDLVGPEHSLQGTPDKTYRTALAGVGYTKAFANGSALNLMLQFDLPEKADNKFHVGAEYAFSRYVALRLGLDDSDFTFGLGVAVRGYGLDYAVFNRETAGTSHPVTFTTDYGRTLYEQQQILAAQRVEEERRLIQEAFTSRVQQHRDAALQNEAGNNIPAALDEWKIVLEYEPGDEEATTHVADLTTRLVEEQARATRDLEMQATIRSHFSQGLQYYQENDYARSRVEWSAILAIDSTHTEAQQYMQRTQDKIDELVNEHIGKARTFENQQRFTEAIGEWNNVQVLQPDHPRAKTTIDRLRRSMESQSQSLQQAARRLRIVNLYNNALQSFNQGNYATAMSGLEELLKLTPDHEETKNLLAMAKRKLTPLTKEEEETIRRLYLRGMQFYSKDEYANAIVEWEKILRIDPTNESVKRNIQEAKDRLKQLDGN